MQNIQIFHCFQTTTKKHPFPSVLWLFKDMQNTNYEGRVDWSTFYKRSMSSCKINITSFHCVPSIFIHKNKEYLRLRYISLVNIRILFNDKVNSLFSHCMIIITKRELFTRHYANFVLSKNLIFKCLHQSGRTKFMYLLPFKNMRLDKLQTVWVELFFNSRPVKFNWQHVKSHRDCFKSV